MAGIYGGGAFDRAREIELDNYLDEEEEEDYDWEDYWER